MINLTNQSKLQELDWTHKRVELFSGANEVAIKYTFVTAPQSQDLLYFDIVINHSHTNEKNGKVFHARVSQRFSFKDYREGAPLDYLYKLMEVTTSLYAQLFYKKREGTNLQHHKIPKPNFEFYKATLALSNEDFRKAQHGNYEL